MPKVSIIVPVYNVEKYLKQALESAVNQTLNDIEIICIDDCSTDNSLNILKEYQLKDKRIKVIEQKENKGQGVARNLALDIAEGEYIMFLDPDDWLELNACEIAYNQISRNKNDIVFFGTKTYLNNKKVFNTNDIRIKPFAEYFDCPQVKLYEIEKPFIKTFEIWYKIYNREYLNKNNIRFAPKRFGEDGIFSLKALVLSNTASFINAQLYNYRRHELSTTSRDFLNKYIEYIAARERNYCSLFNIKNGEKYLVQFLVYYINSLEYWYKRISKVNYQDKKRYYNAIKKIYTKLNKKHDISAISNDIDYVFFKNVLNTTFEITLIKLFTKKIFLFEKKNNRLCIRIFGINIKHKISANNIKKRNVYE